VPVFTAIWTSFVGQCPLVKTAELLCSIEAYSVERSTFYRISKYLTELGLQKPYFSVRVDTRSKRRREGIIGSTTGTKGSTADTAEGKISVC
jgi:hypothetical protein